MWAIKNNTQLQDIYEIYICTFYNKYNISFVRIKDNKKPSIELILVATIIIKGSTLNWGSFQDQCNSQYKSEGNLAGILTFNNKILNSMSRADHLKFFVKPFVFFSRWIYIFLLFSSCGAITIISVRCYDSCGGM